MNVYLDFEWNDFRGDLLSVAMCAANGENMYAEFHFYGSASLWVRENVFPKLIGTPTTLAKVQDMVNAFLWANCRSGAHVIADWPEDIARFCDLLIFGPGERMLTPPLTFEIVQSKAVSLNPHFALADAIALRQWHQKENDHATPTP